MKSFTYYLITIYKFPSENFQKILKAFSTMKSDWNRSVCPVQQLRNSYQNLLPFGSTHHEKKIYTSVSHLNYEIFSISSSSSSSSTNTHHPVYYYVYTYILFIQSKYIATCRPQSKNLTKQLPCSLFYAHYEVQLCIQLWQDLDFNSRWD